MKFVKRTLRIIWTARKTNNYCNEKTNEIEHYKTEAHNVLRSYNEKGREWATPRRVDCPGFEKTQVYRHKLRSRGRGNINRIIGVHDRPILYRHGLPEA